MSKLLGFLPNLLSTSGSFHAGVATFCKDAVTPFAAEEGISPILTSQPTIGCYGNTEEFTTNELEALDAEGRTIITEHKMSNGEFIVVINVYCPRADKENQERVDFKMRFYRMLQNRAEAREEWEVCERLFVIFCWLSSVAVLG